MEAVSIQGIYGSGGIRVRTVYGSYVLQRVRGPGKAFQVTDGSGKVCYQAKQKQFSVGNKIVIYDALGNEEAVIQQALSLIVPKYRITIADKEPFVITRKLALAPQYDIPALQWTVEGRGTQLRCFDGEGRTPFALERAANSWMDRFYIEVYDERYSLHSICVALAIDAAMDAIRKTRKS